MKQWNVYAEKFLKITPREQYLIAGTGVAVIFFLLYNLVLSSAIENLNDTQKKNKLLSAENSRLEQTSNTYEQALIKDPNVGLNAEIAQYKEKLKDVDNKLLDLTSGLIDPFQMRQALLELLNVQKGITLQLFELADTEKLSLPDAPSASSASDVAQQPNEFVLYKHGIKLRLTGNYFQLQQYLTQLESLKWRFFWTKFNYKLTAYPEGELEVIMYSLSTKREFIGV